VNAGRRWPLILIAAPAAVAVWSGWVGLGGLCGFGLVQPFPGIVSWHLDTAITLPVGVEAYGAYALGVWLAVAVVPERARRFAFWSAVGSLALGMLGQVAFHLLTAAHRTRAPWEVVVLVSCMPVAVLGCAAALTHLRRTVPAPEPVPAATAEPYPAEPGAPPPDAEFSRLLDWLTSDSNAVPDVPELYREAGAKFAADLVKRRLPSVRAIRAELGVGQDKASQVQAYLRGELASTSSPNGASADA
jgi:hypothetical protein